MEFLELHYQFVLGVAVAAIWIGAFAWYLIRDQVLTAWLHDRRERRRQRGGF